MLEEQAILPEEPRWTAYLSEPMTPTLSLRGLVARRRRPVPGGFRPGMRRTSMPSAAGQCRHCLSPCDITPADAFSVSLGATAAGRLVPRCSRTWYCAGSAIDLPALYTSWWLRVWGRGPDLADITACPGTDTCKLGISSSRVWQLNCASAHGAEWCARRAGQPLNIKISGCFNSCGQHHIADIGFYGVSRKVGNHVVPHFQVVLGGQATDNAGAYGLSTVAIPSKRIPEVMVRLTDLYAKERQAGETFQAFIKRTGKAAPAVAARRPDARPGLYRRPHLLRRLGGSQGV